jgi:hypothetical protein
MSIRKYRIDATTIPSVTRRRALRQLMWLFPLTAALTAGCLALMSRTQQVELGAVAWIGMGLVVACLAVSFVIGLRKARHGWSTLELTVSDNVLRLQVADMAPVEVLRPNVTRIVDVPGHGLMVHTADPALSLLVSEYLLDFAELRGHLATWRPFERPAVIRDRAKAISFSIGLLGAWVATGIVPDMTIATLAGVALVAMCSVVLRSILRSKTLNNRYKASAVLSLGMFMLAPVARWVLYFMTKGQGGKPS